MIGEPIKRSAKLIGEPVKSTGKNGTPHYTAGGCAQAAYGYDKRNELFLLTVGPAGIRKGPLGSSSTPKT